MKELKIVQRVSQQRGSDNSPNTGRESSSSGFSMNTTTQTALSPSPPLPLQNGGRGLQLNRGRRSTTDFHVTQPSVEIPETSADNVSSKARDVSTSRAKDGAAVPPPHESLPTASSASAKAKPSEAATTTVRVPKKKDAPASAVAVADPKARSPFPGVSSFLDEAPVEACLEYLTRPHHSWDSASKVVELRRERVAEHEASVLARSFAFSRRSSMLSSFSATAGSTGMAALMNSSFASVNSAASAPAGFPRVAHNGSKTQAGALRKSGRLVGSTPAPAALAGPDVSSLSLAPPGSSYSTASAATTTTSRRVGGPTVSGGRVRPAKTASIGHGRSASRDPRASTSGGLPNARRQGKETGAASPTGSLDLMVGGSAIGGGLKGSGNSPALGTSSLFSQAPSTLPAATGTAAGTEVRSRGKTKLSGK